MAAGLQLAHFGVGLNWNVTKANTGFEDSEMTGTHVFSPALTMGSGNTNQVYPVQSTLAVGASVTINLYSLTEPLFNQAIVPVRFYVGWWNFTGATWKYEPGATNGWNGFLFGTSPYIAGGAGDGFGFAGTNAITIDNGVKNIKISNTGAATLTYKLTLFLGS